MGGLAKLITISHVGGGLPDLLQYYNEGGGSLGTPNLYYVIYVLPRIANWKTWFLVANRGSQLTLLRKWWFLVSHGWCQLTFGAERGRGGLRGDRKTNKQTSSKIYTTKSSSLPCMCWKAASRDVEKEAALRRCRSRSCEVQADHCNQDDFQLQDDNCN